MMGSFATLRCNEGYKPTIQNQIACITGTWYPMEELGNCVSNSTGTYFSFFKRKKSSDS